MSAEHLCELLSALTRRGASLSPLNSTQELDELADSFHSLALGVRERGNAEECEAVGRAVRAAADAIDAWQPAAAPAALAAQLQAAFKALCACGHLVNTMQLPLSVGKRLCRSISKQLAAGSAALVGSGDSGGLADAAPVDRLAHMSVTQASAICYAVGISMSHTSQQLTTLLPLATLVGWFRAIATLLSRLPPSGWEAGFLARSAATVTASPYLWIACEGSFAAALAKDKSVCRSLVNALLTQLHQAAEAAEADPPPTVLAWHTTVMLAQACLAGPLVAELQLQLGSTSGMAALSSTAQLMLCLPPGLDGGSSGGSSNYTAQAHLALATLLNLACNAQFEQRRASQQQGEQTVRLLLRVMPTLGPALQLAAEAAAVAHLEKLCCAWSGVLQSLVDVGGQLRTAAGAAQPTPLPAAAAAPATAVPSGSFCTAAAALMQSLPLLRQAEQRLLQERRPGGAARPVPTLEGQEAGQLAHWVILFGVHAADHDVAATGGDQHAGAAVLPAAWELASCACKLALQMMTEPCSPGQVVWPDALLRVSGRTMLAAARLHPPARLTALQSPLQRDRSVPAMALAQLHATQALLAWSRLGQSLHRFSGRHHLFTIVASAAAMVSPATLVAEPEWRALLKAAVVELPQDDRHRQDDYFDILWSVVHFTAAPVAAVLAADGLLAAMLRDIRRLRLSDEQRERLSLLAAKAVAILCKLGVTMGTLSCLPAQPSGGSSSAPAASSTGLHPVQQLAAVHEQALALQAAFHEAGLGCLITDDEAGVPVQPETALRLCLSSLRLASSLLQWWQRPEHAVTDRLLLAQIAAARSCAYLGCTNLQSSLGPAAVKGEGRLKCSKCLVAQYCSTACSHADWRTGGHHRVCRSLRAARNEDKERAAAAAAAQAAAAGAAFEEEL